MRLLYTVACCGCWLVVLVCLWFRPRDSVGDYGWLGRGVDSVVVDGGCWSCVWVGFGVVVTVLSIVGWYCCLLCWCFCLILGF